MALLFLRRVQQVEVHRNGTLLRSVRRQLEGNRLTIADGEESCGWYLLQGSFATAAARLRDAFRQIEEKRNHTVTVAVPAVPRDEEGSLCAFLPTQTRTGMGLHINADFFPSSDRKRVLFETDFQGQWNRAAISAAAGAVATALPTLPELLGPEALWNLFEEIHSQETDDVFGEFWNQLEPALPANRIVFTSTSTWHRPSETLFLEKEEEHNSTPLLELLGLRVVHPSLRSHSNLLRRSSVGVRLLMPHDLAEALVRAGLTGTVEISAAPAWIRSEEHRSALGREIEILLQRQMSDADRTKARHALFQSALAIGRDGKLHPLDQMRRADNETMEMFANIDIKGQFLGDENPASIESLVPLFNVNDAIGSLTQYAPDDLKVGYVAGRWAPRDLLRWFDVRKADLGAQKGELSSLPIFPSAGELRPLTELAVPGSFNDPLRLASLVSVQELPGLHDFIRELGAQELTFAAYARDQVPRAFARVESVPPDSRRMLSLLLAEHLGEVRDDAVAQRKLAGCPLIECDDGEFRAARDIYIDARQVRPLLGDTAPVAIIPAKHAESVRALLLWLGAHESPRASDLLVRIRQLIGRSPTTPERTAMKLLFAHIGDRWVKDRSIFESALDELQEAAWLPGTHDEASWYAPRTVYASYRRHLFESQATFLDIDLQTQQRCNDFIRWLGVALEPTVAQVVQHLSSYAGAGRPVNSEVYRFLNENADRPEISSLRGKACLLLEGIGYVRADQVYWADHPFGSLRYRLSGELRTYGKLFERLGVRETPQWDDAISVLREMSAQFGSSNLPLDDAAHDVVVSCWRFLDRALTDGPLAPDQLKELSSIKVVPDPRRILVRPDWMYFEDRPGLVAKFGDVIRNNAIRRVHAAWRPMEAAGVRPLSRAVRAELVECRDPTVANDIRIRLSERRVLLARVVEALQTTDGASPTLDPVSTLRIERSPELVVRFAIDVFGQTIRTEPESVTVHHDPSAEVLYLNDCEGLPWAALARELSYIVSPEAEAGQLAPGFKEVLSADSFEAANRALDDLGYAPLEHIKTGDGNAQQQPVDLGSDGQGTPGPQISSATDAIQALLGGNVPPPQPPPSQLDQGQGQGFRGGGGVGGGTGARGTRTPGKQRGRLRTYVAPPGATTTPDPYAAARRGEVEQAGVDRVVAFERDAGRDPRVMPVNHPGYDVESRDTAGNVERYIEVKAFSSTWGSIGAGLSREEFTKAGAVGDRYWLYVVERAQAHDFRILRIQNPARQVEQFFYDDGWRDLAEPDPVVQPATSVDQGDAPAMAEDAPEEISALPETARDE
jgi:hypothetical protein